MKTNLYIFIILLLITSSCQEDQKIISPKGNIVGFVKLLDENGLELSDRSGVKISIDADHFVSTNSIGKFEINDAESGNYKFLFEKTGYGTVKSYNYIFAAGKVPGVVPTVTLMGLPSLSTSNVVAELSDSQSIHISGSMTTKNQGYYFIYFIGETASVNNINYTSAYGYSFCCSLETGFSHYVPSPSLSSIYITGYAVSYGNQNNSYQYFDYETNKTVNPAVKQLFMPIKVK